MPVADAIAAVQSKFPELGLAAAPLCTHLDGRPSDQLRLIISADRLLDVCRFLRDDPRCRFEQLADLTCVDYLNFPGEHPGRFGVTYSLLSLTHNHRLWLKVYVDDPQPTVPSVFGVWPGANWPEREVFDLFGIAFSGHPDLRRIVCPDWFTCHPLRKDYPLTGRGERTQFTPVTRESA